METVKLELKANEQKTVQVPSRGASGLQLLFNIEDTSIIDVVRRELLPEELDTLNLKPGDSLPALFVITAKKAGASKIQFVERRAGMKDMPDMPLKDYEVKVSN